MPVLRVGDLGREKRGYVPVRKIIQTLLFGREYNKSDVQLNCFYVTTVIIYSGNSVVIAVIS